MSDRTVVPPTPLVLWEVIQTGHVVARAFRAAFAAAGLTPQQFGVLVALSEDPRATRAALARSALVRPQSIGRVIDGMLTTGLLDQSGPRGRGLPAQLSVTPEGERRLAQAWPLVRDLNSPPTIGMNSREAESLCAALVSLRERLNA